MTDIVLSTFVRRQTKASRFSHFEGTEADLLARTVADFDSQNPGYRDGVVLVPMTDLSGFMSAVVVVEPGDQLVATFESRRDGEAPRKTSRCAIGRSKAPAVRADIVLYRKDVLAEDPKHVSLGEWEIVSINCSPVDEDMPIEPSVLLHNHFESDGGSATGMSPEALVEQLRVSHAWWADKAFVADAAMIERLKDSLGE